MDPQLYFTCKRDDVSDAFKTILPFPWLELFSWFKRIKITQEYLPIHLMSMNRSAKLWFFSFNSAPVSLRGPLSPEAFLMNQRMFKWNKRPVCSSPISPVYYFPPAPSVFYPTSFKNCQIFLHVFYVWFLLAKEDNNYLNILFFLFHKIIKYFWFLLWPKHHRHKQTRSEFAKADGT